MTEPKYRIIVRGKAVACAECGTVFEGGNCRNMASSCFDSHFLEPEVRPFLPYEKEPKAEGEGVLFPDKHGHWKRLSESNPDRKKVEYNKAMHQAANRDREDQKRLIRDLFKSSQVWKDNISPLQRLSYAYHHGSWESVRQAAYALAYSEALRKKIDSLDIPLLIREALQLDNLAAEVMRDSQAIDLEQAKREVQYKMTELDIQTFLDQLERGE